MTSQKNPFEYEQATKLTPDEVRKYYIEDFNYSRFISSRRNVLLVGERGTGKTMTFLYYMLQTQVAKADEKKEDIDLSIVSVYVPCNNPLTHRREYELLDPLNASLVSEHFMVVSMMHEVLQAIFCVSGIATPDEESALRGEVEYSLNIHLSSQIPFKRAFALALNRSSTEIQESLNGDEEDIKKSFLSFNSGIRSFLACLKQIEKLRNSHFSFMIDDAQLYNPYQNRALNSWIAYRDNTLFSFKVATTRVDAPPLTTSSGGIILEGHDFTRLEMEQPYQNKTSAFGKLARRIVQTRLNVINVDKSPDEFFPESPSFIKDIEECGRRAEEEAKRKYPDGTTTQISDYKYKYTRAIYFRERPDRANLPPYSGFNLLTHLSTGVIRNLLNPCYKMYDRQISENRSKGDDYISQISPEIQKEIILDLSKKIWEWIQNDMDNQIEGCSRDLAKGVFRLLDNLAILFKKRLQSHISETRAIEFTISGLNEERHKYLLEVLKIAQKAQLIYTYRSSAKDLGRRETYYMPNKMLWPERGLDPEGQHARVSITADNLLNAAKNNTEIPFSGDKTDELPLFSSEF